MIDEPRGQELDVALQLLLGLGCKCCGGGAAPTSESYLCEDCQNPFAAEYTSSLDTMHGVETWIEERGLTKEYTREVFRLACHKNGTQEHFNLLHATAAQKALAAYLVLVAREAKGG